jgi:mono/diheme cytochrome c family protein
MVPPSPNYPTCGEITPLPALRADLPLKGGGIFTVMVVMAALFGVKASAAPPADMMQGGNVFAITCSSSFCHGDGGVGARGPSLRNRNFMPDFVRNTVTNGRSGTPMPSFKGSLSPHEIDMVVDYVMSLSPDNHSTNAGPVAPVPASAPPPAPLSVQAEAGRKVFFDLARAGSCAACHSYHDEGGPIGADLSAVAKRTPHDIYQAIAKPNVPNADYPVATAGGVTGILKQKTDRLIQLYDLSSVPPVLRSFYPADGVKIEEAKSAAPIYSHDLSGYSKDEVTGLIAFLKSAAGPAKDVTPQDLAQP